MLPFSFLFSEHGIIYPTLGLMDGTFTDVMISQRTAL